MIDCKWLPDCYDYPDWNNFQQYEDGLYNLFREQVIEGDLSFRDKKIMIRRHPIENNKEEAFYHCTCKNYTKANNRQPDPERMVRLPWLVPLLLNYDCQEDCCNDKPLKWRKLDKSKHYRYYLYFNYYLIILEDRPNYFLLITAFYVEDDYYDRGLRIDAQKPENAINE